MYNMIIREGNTHFICTSPSRFKKDLRFFAQTICSTALFSLTVVSFHTIALFVSGRMAKFCATTLIWGVNHSGAGFIVVAFNSDIRKAILVLVRLSTPTSTKVTSWHPPQDRTIQPRSTQ
uniref:7TM_GPCR_Srx domain-containing protein n=1 Tax=Haemonchus contortus TaxID=6289 RepID=A0A7I4Y2R8_HAECO